MKGKPMKVSYVLTALVLTAAPAFASTPITTDQARGMGGGNMTVRGVVTAVTPVANAQERGVYITVTDQDATALHAYVPTGDLRKFPDLLALNGQTVDVSGVVETSFGVPEIEVTSPDQVAVVR
jgi:hypothetical protein